MLDDEISSIFGLYYGDAITGTVFTREKESMFVVSCREGEHVAVSCMEWDKSWMNNKVWGLMD